MALFRDSDGPYFSQKHFDPKRDLLFDPKRADALLACFEGLLAPSDAGDVPGREPNNIHKMAHP